MTLAAALPFRDIEAVQEVLFFITVLPLLSSTPLVRCVFGKRQHQQQQFLWQTGFFEGQALPVHYLTQDHFLQHWHMLPLDFIIPEAYSCLTSLKPLINHK